MTVPTDEPWGERFSETANRLFGLRFDDSKLPFLVDVLHTRCQVQHLAPAHYLARLEADANEQRDLATQLTVGETYFFRNADQFRALGEAVLPELMREHDGDRNLSLLSAGCSSGEEAYTLAMLAQGHIPMPPWRVSIRAVDLNQSSLRRAAAGRYGQWSLREMPEPMRERWFTPAGRDFDLDPALRATVEFGWANLSDPDSDLWRPAAYHVIFCRNVIMYFSPAVQRAVVARLTEALVPGGYLFLGHAETLRGLSQDFHLVHTHDTFYYQRHGGERAAPSSRDADVPPVPLTRTRPSAPPPAADSGWFETIGAASRRIEALLPRGTVDAPAPQSGQAWNLETVLDLLRRERFAEALELLSQRPEPIAADPDLLLLEALLLVEDGQLQPAQDVCTLLLAESELNTGAHYVLGLYHEAEGDQRRALHNYAIAAHLDPHFAMPRLRGGLLARKAGRLVDARRDLDAALDLLQNEDTSRLLMFGGGFTRGALTAMCEAEIRACGVAA